MKLLPLLMAVVALAAGHISSEKYRSDNEWYTSELTNPEIRDRHFTSGREYKFMYDGQLTTSIPTSSRLTSGTRIQAVVSMVFKSDNRVLLKMLKTRFGKLNEEIPEVKDSLPFEAFEEVEPEQEIKQKMQLPIEFQYVDGLIQNVKFENQEQPWSANIKRGVLNMIQMNIKRNQQVRNARYEESSEENLFSFENLGNSVSDSKESRSSEEVSKRSQQNSFTAMEKTLEGECETLYTVIPQSCSQSSVKECQSENAKLFKVIKSINFDRCTRRPELRYNERFRELCRQDSKHCNQEDFEQQERNLRSSSVITMTVLCPSSVPEKKCLVEKSVSESEYNYLMFGEDANVITTYVRQTLELVQTNNVESPVTELQNPISSDSDMIYTQDWDVMKEEFFMEGDSEFDEKTPFSKIQDKLPFVQNIMEKLVHYTRKQVETEAPRQLSRLVRVLRMLKQKEIQEIYEQLLSEHDRFSQEEREKVKELFIDALGLCGTHNCMEQVIEQVEKQSISPIRAAMVIRKFMETRVVSRKMINRMWDWCNKESSVCKQHERVQQAVYLTVGSMVNSYCDSKRFDKLALSSKLESPKGSKRSHHCQKDFRDNFVQELIEKFRSTSEEYKQVLVLKTLANAALIESVKPLKEIIMDRSFNPTVRTEAIISLNQLTLVIPEKIVRELLPIFVDRRELPQIRVSALYMILESQPDKLVIDQIVRVLKTERNLQVASFTYTLLQAKSNTIQPCLKQLSKDIKLSLRFISQMKVDRFMQQSKYTNVFEKLSKNRQQFFSLHTSQFNSRSSVPNKLSARFNLNVAKMWCPKFVTVDFTQSGLSKVLNQLWRSYSQQLQTPLSELLNGRFQRHSGENTYQSELKNIFEKLNINIDETESETTPFGVLDLKLKNMNYAFWPITQESIREQISDFFNGDSSSSSFVKFSNRVFRDRSAPFKAITGTFVHEQERKIPTSLGLPIKVSLKVPTVMHVSGSVKFDVDETEPLQRMKLIVKDFKPSMVATVVTKVEAWSPIVNSGLKVASSLKLFAPFEAEVSVNAQIETPEIKVIVKPLFIENQPEEIFAITTRPSTFVQVWPKSLQTWNEPEERTLRNTYGERVHEHDMSIGENSIGIRLRSRSMWHRSPKDKHSSMPIGLLSGVNKYSLTMSPGNDMPKEYIMTITGKTFVSNGERVTVDVDNSRDEILLSEETKLRSKNEIESPLVSEMAVRIQTAGSSIDRSVKVDSKCHLDYNLKAHKCELKIVRGQTPTKEEWKLMAKLNVILPKTPLTLSQLTKDKAIMTSFKAEWGSINDQNERINIQIVKQQSNKIRELHERSLYKKQFDNEEIRNAYRSLFSPVSQYNQLKKYSLLDQTNIEISHKLNQQTKHFVKRLYNYMYNKLYDYSESQSTGRLENDQESKVLAQINIDPQTRRYFNVTIKTSDEKVKFIDVPMPYRLPNWMYLRNIGRRSSRTPYSLFMSLISSSDNRVCQARTDRVKTFDELEHSIPTSSCWTVLANDCESPEESRFAVLIKKKSAQKDSQNEQEQKELKIVTRNVKLTIKPTTGNQLECKLNDQSEPCEELSKNSRLQNRIICEATNELVECELPISGLKVFFDGYSADIKVAHFYRNQVCGLCGNNDALYYNDRYTGRRSVESSEQWSAEYSQEQQERPSWMESMLNKYLVRDSDSETCQHQFSEIRRPKWESLNSRQQNSWEQDSFEDEFDTELQRPVRERYGKVNPVQKTRILEQAGQLCFSTKPVKTCPRGTHSTKEESEKRTVSFACLSRYDEEAERMESLVARRGVLENIDIPKSFSEDIREPKECRYYN